MANREVRTISQRLSLRSPQVKSLEILADVLDIIDLRKGADPAALARYLLTVCNGICVQAASGASTKELHEVASMALMGWPGVVKRARSRAAAKADAAIADV